jgi:hypothetical protein
MSRRDPMRTSEAVAPRFQISPKARASGIHAKSTLCQIIPAPRDAKSVVPDLILESPRNPSRPRKGRTGSTQRPGRIQMFSTVTTKPTRRRAQERGP